MEQARAESGSGRIGRRRRGGVDDWHVYPPSIAEDSPFRSILFLVFCLPTQPYHISIYIFFLEFFLAGVYMQLYLSPGSLLSCDFFYCLEMLKLTCSKLDRRYSAMKRVNYAIAVKTMAI